MRHQLLPLIALAAAALAAPAHADEAAIRENMKKRYPNVQVASVVRTPIPGIYEVFTGGQIIYTDEKANYLIDGMIIDAEKKVNLTQDRMSKLNAVKFSELPLKDSFRIVRGKGTRKVGYFADPNCSYCKKVEQDLNKLDDVTIHVFLYPILGQDSMDKAKAVWCSRDKSKAWLDWMLAGTAPKGPGTCDTSAIDKVMAFGKSKNISGTPTFILEDGQRVPGAIPLAQLEKMIADARPGK
jgi:thiol:disulfide interchange protein DsbC